jgi:hypothetical protein
MKDAKGHGSNRRGKAKVSVDPSKLGFRMADIGAGRTEHNVVTGGAWGDKAAAHQAGVNEVGGKRAITIFHQDGEYAVPNGKGHYFTNDKADAEGTARTIHGHDITIKHRAKVWGPEMD